MSRVTRQPTVWTANSVAEHLGVGTDAVRTKLKNAATQMTSATMTPSRPRLATLPLPIRDRRWFHH